MVLNCWGLTIPSFLVYLQQPQYIAPTAEMWDQIPQGIYEGLSWFLSFCFLAQVIALHSLLADGPLTPDLFFPVAGEISYPQKEIHSSARVAKLYPELGVEEDDFTRLRLIHGLEIVHHPDLSTVDLTQDDIDW
jgi:hypothetical protein